MLKDEWTACAVQKNIEINVGEIKMEYESSTAEAQEERQRMAAEIAYVLLIVTPFTVIKPLYKINFISTSIQKTVLANFTKKSSQ